VTNIINLRTQLFRHSNFIAIAFPNYFYTTVVAILYP